MKRKSMISQAKVFIFIFLGLVFLIAWGDFPQATQAPLNPEFTRYLMDLEKGEVPFISDDGYALGEIPAPFDLSHVKNVNLAGYLDSYPATYDLRTMGKLTSVKNQGGCGSCWTFAALASLESYGKPSNDWNFSEQDMNANHGFDVAECAGGNHYISSAYLARWDGPLSESDVPYPYGEGAVPGLDTYSPKKHVQQIVFLPQRSGPLDNDTIKDFVTTFGAVYVSFYYNSTYMDSSDLNYYCDGTTSTNHAVAVVGWDDNYDKSNFKTTPPGNGAFIIRNSWGTGRHDNGYFYLSYYDTSFKPRASLNNADPPYNYERIYQYDPLGAVNALGYGSTVAWGANIFTAVDNRPLRAVAFYTNDVNTSYTIYVYTGVSGSDPKNGVLAATKTGSKTYPGFYTVDLDFPVSLTNGENFSVVIQFSNTSYTYPVSAEMAVGGYSSSATASAGESYVSSSGSSWYDMSADGYNACIKAYASSGSIQTADPDFNNDGKADIVWRYYATGGYNTVWLRGTVITSPSLFSINDISSKIDPGITDMDEIEGKMGTVDSVDMDTLLQRLNERGIEDGFEDFGINKGDETKFLSDPFAMGKMFESQSTSRIMALTVADPRNDPEAVNLPTAQNTNWRLSGTGDFNNDGKVDLVWRHLGNGKNAVWYMDGVSLTGTAMLPTAPDVNWVLSGTGDFNNDGKVDLVWRHIGDGRNAVWYMDGVTMTGVALLPTASNLNWMLGGTGDFNNDGKVDLVWRHMGDGRNAVWYMDGVTMTGSALLPTASNLSWLMCGAGDFNNDGKVDLVWRNISDGKNAIWYLDGVALISIESLTTVTDTNWIIEN